MSWRAEARPAAFRGVPFWVEDAGASGGRRGEDHEYPQRERGWAEDLGAAARQGTLAGYLIGPDHRAQAARLEAALGRAGPGTLDHPHRGELRVQVRRWRFAERAAEGGMTRVHLDFVEAGENVQPTAAPDTGAEAGRAADAAEAAARRAFRVAARLATMTDTVRAALRGDIGAIVAVTGEALAMIPVRDIAAAAGLDRALAGLAAAADRDIDLGDAAALAGRVGDAVDLLRRSGAVDVARPALARLGWADGADGALGIVDTASGLVGARDAPTAARRGLDRLAGFGTLPAPGSGPAATAAANGAAVTRLVRRVATVAIARATLDRPSDDRPPGDRADALALRDDVLGALDRVVLDAGETGEDAVAGAFAGLSVAVARHLSGRADRARPAPAETGAALPVPSLVAAYRAAGDAAGAPALAAGAWHPAFVGGVGS